ncbi:MAG: DUF4173 domain-containing protein [Pyrinomonadaceae bacterium]
MNEQTKTGIQIIQVAVVLGVAGDLLLRATPWGVNVLLFNVIFAGAMLTLLWKRAPEQVTRQTLALFGAMVFFASMFAWRGAIELRVADTIAILVILSVLFVPKLRVPTQLAGVVHYGVGFVLSSLHAIGAPFVLVFNDVEWNTIPRDGWRKHVYSTLRGIAIATPLILIFGGLFVAADAAYAGLVERVFDVRPEIVFSHIALFGLFGWMTAGYLRGVLIRSDSDIDVFNTDLSVVSADAATAASKVDDFRAESGEHPITLGDRSIVDHLNISDPPDKDAKAETAESVPEASENQKKTTWANFDNTIMPPVFTLGTVEIGVILGLMNLLFLSFVIVQVPYLFGGMELVQNTPDFKLAEYARRGFGELVTVAGLVLPILLASHWLIRKETRLAENLFRVFAGIQIALLFVIMVSAVQRLVLLTGDLGYGMTTVRLYPLIFMSWLAIVFIWFAVTVLRGARKHFAWGALWAAFIVLGGAHVLNPDALIVKTNIALMQQGREFDASYNSNLSDDALPALFSAIPDMSPEDRQTVAFRLANRFCEMREESDIRSSNLSRARAWSILDSSGPFKEEIDCNIRYHISPWGID